MSPTQSEYFGYEKVGIVHKVIMYQASRDAMKDYFECLTYILQSLDEGEPFLTVLDISQSGFPSVNLGVAESGRIMSKFSKNRVFRSLVVHDDSNIAHIASIMLRPLRFLNTKFIKPSEVDQFWDWLVSDS